MVCILIGALTDINSKFEQYLIDCCEILYHQHTTILVEIYLQNECHSHQAGHQARVYMSSMINGLRISTFNMRFLSSQII